MTGLDTLGLYVHLPWCIRKCPYCDFNSHAISESVIPESEYVDCLLQDLDSELQRTSKPIKTVYFGGGTPSLFSPAAFERLLSHPYLSSVNEVTLEANPGTLESHDLRAFRETGINRLSMGVQSLNSDHLAALGRIHSVEDVYRCVDEAKSAGFSSINLDLMYGLPRQTAAQALLDLERLIALEPNHISWYQLTIEPNTQFYKHPPVLASDDERAEISEQGVEMLTEASFERYEVSAYAKSGHRCEHNLNYWRFGDYLGIGAGAHGKLTLDCSRIVRSRKRRLPNQYMKDQGPIENAIPAADLTVEFMMNALRLTRGVEHERFVAATGIELNRLSPILDQLHRMKLLERDRLALTNRGYDLLDSVVEMFLRADLSEV